MLLSLLLSLAVFAPPAYREVAQLQLHSAFWPNLHHTLYAASLPSGRPLGSPVKGALTDGMTDAERAAWDGAVAFYAREFAGKDLRTGDGMTAINNALAASGDDRLSSGTALTPAHAAALTAVGPYVDDSAMTLETAMKSWMQDGQLFAFRSGFWVNLHHFVYVLGRARNGAADSRRAAVVKAPADVEGLASRSESERAAWDESIHYYAAGLSTKDAVFDAALIDITRKLAAAPDEADPASFGLPPELASTLKLAAPVYRAVWWPRHSRANAARRTRPRGLRRPARRRRGEATDDSVPGAVAGAAAHDRSGRLCELGRRLFNRRRAHRLCLDRRGDRRRAGARDPPARILAPVGRGRRAPAGGYCGDAWKTGSGWVVARDDLLHLGRDRVRADSGTRAVRRQERHLDARREPGDQAAARWALAALHSR